MAAYYSEPAFCIIRRTFELPPAKQLTIVEEAGVPLIYFVREEAERAARSMEEKAKLTAFYSAASFDLVRRV